MNNNDQKLWTFHQTDNAGNLMLGHPRQDALFKKVIAYIKTGNLLEIGFGDGYFLKRLSKKYECYGADISVENIEQMKKKIPDVKFDVISVDGLLPYKDSFFDAFVASEVLEHMSDEELRVSVSEIERILKPGGLAIITVPAEENLKDSECFCPNCGEVFHKWGHKQSWNEKKINELFENFKVESVKKIIFTSPNLNFFGKVELLLKRVFLDIIDISGTSYLILLQKK